MLIDSHCHLPDNLDEAKTVVNFAEADGVVKMINIGTSLKDSRDALTMANHFDNVWSTAAVYPHEDREISIDEIVNELEILIDSSPKIVAIGECGIDLADGENERSLIDQCELFEAQIKLAIKKDLPLVIHNRNGDKYVLELLKKYSSTGNLRGVAHCFASDWEVAQQLINLNFLISFSGMITYPSRKSLLGVVKNVSLDNFVLETDAPYLPPQGHRGEKNEPKYVKIVAQKVAEVKELPFELIAKLSYENTSRVFNI